MLSEHSARFVEKRRFGRLPSNSEKIRHQVSFFCSAVSARIVKNKEQIYTACQTMASETTNEAFLSKNKNFVLKLRLVGVGGE